MKASLQDLQCFRAQSSITAWVRVPGDPLTWGKYSGVCLLRQHQSSQDALYGLTLERPWTFFYLQFGSTGVCLGTLEDGSTAAFMVVQCFNVRGV